ncbi:hypothetical protein RDABS01_010545 [Bienertia sinuspersici]
MINTSLALTYLYLLIYILLSSAVILYNKWVLSPKYFNFPFPITLTMVHMGFSGVVAFFLVRVFKVVSPVKMTFEIYATCVIPISAFFASSLWFGNTAYLHISVAFIQMLKALMPVATFVMAVVCGTDKLRCDVFLNMVLVSVGVVISSYGEIHFNIIGTLYQVTGIFAEALRLVLTQVLLQKKGLSLNPITSLYYIAPCRTGAVTIRVAGVLKDWILIALSTVIFPESTITGLNITGYAIALVGVVMYNYLKVKDVRASQPASPERIQERVAKGVAGDVGGDVGGLVALVGWWHGAAGGAGRLVGRVLLVVLLVVRLVVINEVDDKWCYVIEPCWSVENMTQDWKFEKKSSDIYVPNDDGVKNGGSGGSISPSEVIMDEEAPLVSSSRLSHIGRTQVNP